MRITVLTALTRLQLIVDTHDRVAQHSIPPEYLREEIFKTALEVGRGLQLVVEENAE